MTYAEIHEAWDIIDKLRSPEGNSVTLFCDNPDFNDQPSSAVEVCAEFTGWDTKRFTGDNIVEALRAALSTAQHVA